MIRRRIAALTDERDDHPIPRRIQSRGLDLQEKGDFTVAARIGEDVKLRHASQPVAEFVRQQAVFFMMGVQRRDHLVQHRIIGTAFGLGF